MPFLVIPQLAAGGFIFSQGVAKVLMCYDRYRNERNRNTRGAQNSGWSQICLEVVKGRCLVCGRLRTPLEATAMVVLPMGSQRSHSDRHTPKSASNEKCDRIPNRTFLFKCARWSRYATKRSKLRGISPLETLNLSEFVDGCS
jgi:hypothetical protein